MNNESCTFGNETFLSFCRGVKSRNVPWWGNLLVTKKHRKTVVSIFGFMMHIDDCVDRVRYSRLEPDKAEKVENFNSILNTLVQDYRMSPSSVKVSSAMSLMGPTVRDLRYLSLSSAVKDVLREAGRSLDEPETYIRNQFAQGAKQAWADRSEEEWYYRNVSEYPLIWLAKNFGLDENALMNARMSIRAYQVIDDLWDLKEDVESGWVSVPLDSLRSAGYDYERFRAAVHMGFDRDPNFWHVLISRLDDASAVVDRLGTWYNSASPGARGFMHWDYKVNRQRISHLKDCFNRKLLHGEIGESREFSGSILMAKCIVRAKISLFCLYAAIIFSKLLRG